MPTKKSVGFSESHDTSKSLSSLPSKILASDDGHEMDIDGPAVITEVLSDRDELPHANSIPYSSEDLDGMNQLEDGLGGINETSISDELPTEIMDTSVEQHSSALESMLPNSAVEPMDETLSRLVSEPDVLLSELNNTKDLNDAISVANSLDTSSVVTTAAKMTHVSISKPSKARTVTVTAGSQNTPRSTSTQQIRLIPISQAGTSGIPVQILQNQASNGTQIVLTSVPGSPNKAVLKSIGPLNSSLVLSPSKQNVPSSTVSPVKQVLKNLVVGKMLSPTKSPSKMAMIPVAISKSSQVQKFLPTLSVSGNSSVSLMTTTAPARTSVSIINSASPTVISAPDLQRLIPANQQQTGQRVVSPTKVIQVRGQVAPGPMIARLSGPGIKHISAVPSNTLQGNKVQFIRLVTSTAGKTSATVVPVSSMLTATSSASKIISAGTVTTTTTTPNTTTPVRPAVRPSSNPIRMTIPIAPAVQAQSIRPATPRMAQKVLIPAPNVSGITQIRQSVPVSTLNRLPPGATLISGGNNQSIVMVPAQYLNQFQTGPQSATPKSAIAPKPTVSTSPPIAVDAESNVGNVVQAKAGLAIPKSVDANGSRQRKPCNCTKSQCLKLYCDCFANGEFCSNCNCNRCFNNLDHEEERQKAIKACLDRNPQAFHPKIGKGRSGDVERRHNKGCNCKRSGCFKNYCECYEAKILCTDMCKCVGCKNYEETADRKSLMHLADAAEVRVQQQNDATNKFPLQIGDLPSRPSTISSSGEKLPFSFVTNDVAEVTCQCLLAQAEEAEKDNFSKVAAENLILEEFGRCLRKIIEYAHKTKLHV